MAKKLTIGIDLGTTNTCIAVVRDGTPEIIENDSGSRTTPSVVAYDANMNIIFGDNALRQIAVNAQNTIYESKRLIGLSHDEFIHQKTSGKINLNYNVVSDSKGVAISMKNGVKKTPIEIASTILRKCKEFACTKLDLDPKSSLDAVITVPAYFNDSQRQSTKDAGTVAGLNVVRIINEPTAAALAYTKQKKIHDKGIIAVYDFGGGTFDVSILEISADNDDGHSNSTIEVKSTNGDTNLGGALIDEAIFKHLVNEICREHGLNNSQLTDDVSICADIKAEAESAKKALSSKTEHEIMMRLIIGSRQVIVNIKLNRATLDRLMKDIIDKTLDCCRTALKDAKLEANDIDSVVLVGGSTRIPLVQSKVKDLFGKEPKRDINPDEVVAMGASIQGAVLQGDVKDILLVDVTPLSLGIETEGGILTKMIEKNTEIPTKKSQVFSTAQDNQTAVTISLYQGERPMARDNHHLGRFDLVNIPPAQRGIPQIEVTIAIDTNGIIHLSAKDKATGKENKISISGDNKLSKEDIERMKREYEENKSADEEKEKFVSTRNILSHSIFEAEDMIKNHSEKIANEDKESLTRLVSTCKEYVNNETVNGEKVVLGDLESKKTELSDLMSKIGAKIHNSNDQKSSNDSANTGNNPDPQKPDATE